MPNRLECFQYLFIYFFFLKEHWYIDMLSMLTRWSHKSLILHEQISINDAGHWMMTIPGYNRILTFTFTVKYRLCFLSIWHSKYKKKHPNCIIGSEVRAVSLNRCRLVVITSLLFARSLSQFCKRPKSPRSIAISLRGLAAFFCPLNLPSGAGGDQRRGFTEETFISL